VQGHAIEGGRNRSCRSENGYLLDQKEDRLLDRELKDGQILQDELTTSRIGEDRTERGFVEDIVVEIAEPQ